MSGLEGKKVLVTGASSGIGAEAAKHFAALKGPHHLHKANGGITSISLSMPPYVLPGQWA